MKLRTFIQLTKDAFQLKPSQPVQRKQILYRRLPTALLRGLPDFMLIGLEKCGSSSLHHYLKDHPNLFGSLVKEPHFFDREFFSKQYEPNYYWYRLFFPLKTTVRRREKELNSPCKVFESTPSYLFDPYVPERIKKINPSAKLICLLRNPVTRAQSDFYYRLGSVYPTQTKNGDAMTFEKAIEIEMKRLPDPENIESIWGIGAPMDKKHPQTSFRCLRQGLYYFMLKHWFNFFDRDQFLILKSENLFTSTKTTLNRVADYLGIPSFQSNEFPVFNKGEYSPVKHSTLEKLKKFFAPINKKLYELINRDMQWEMEIPTK